jgi:hypothetical protein
MIIYSLVARGSLVLAEYTSFDGDFPSLARKILVKSQKSKSKKSFYKDNYVFTLFTEEEFTFLCLNMNTVSKEISYKFLDQIAEIFYSEQRKQDDTKSWSAHFSVKIKKIMVN